MAMLLVLMPAETEVGLPSEAILALGRLGVTSIALVRDDRSLGMVVEGWAFDPVTSGDAVLAAVGGPSSGARTLMPVLEMSLSQGGHG